MSKKLFVLLLIISLAFALYVPAGANGNKPAGPQAPRVDVIVHASKPYDSAIEGIRSLGGKVTIQYENVDGLAAQIPADKLSDLRALPEVERVEKDLIVNLPPAPEEGLEPRPLEEGGIEVFNAEELSELTDGFPDLYYSYLSDVTGAQDTWDQTGFGAESLVAVIDTGTAPDGSCLPSDRVIEGPDFSPDRGTDREGSTRADNHWHGTSVANLAVADCVIALPADSGLAEIFTTHLPPEAFFAIDIPGVGPVVVIPLNGIAPAASIYAVKVFPHTGAGIPTSIVNQALDHVITAKKSGLDIDVVNMSLGGASLYDGWTLNEMLVDAATEAGMIMAIAAGNDGPAPVSIARPGTAFSALTAAAASDPVHTRILLDVAFGPGQGLAMYPRDEIRPADFSSRGPLADGREGPDVSATGVFNFTLFTPPFCPRDSFCFGWASGTSFATPTVAGGAALLNAWAELNDPSIGPRAIRNAVMDGAVPLGGWSELAQGNGYLNVPNSLALLQAGKVDDGLRRTRAGILKPNILTGNKNEASQTVTLSPEQTFDWVLEISENTERVEIDIDVLDGPVDPGPGAIPNSFEFYVKSAKRGGAPYIINTANVFDDASAVIGDGFVVLSGGFASELDVPPNQWPMEPGLMKVTLESDWSNNAAELSATVTIRRFEGPQGNKAGGITRTVGDGEFQVFSVDVPAGTTGATFDLSWKQNWDKFPTNDLDMLFVSPSSFPFLDLDFLAAATLNAPERQVIEEPEAGTWFVIVDGFTVHHGKDPYVLQVTLED